MVSMEFLKDEEIDAVLQYIEFASSSNTNKAGVNGANIPKLQQYASTTVLIDKNTNPQKHFFSVLFIIIALAGVVIHGILITKFFHYLNRR